MAFSAGSAFNLVGQPSADTLFACPRDRRLQDRNPSGAIAHGLIWLAVGAALRTRAAITSQQPVAMSA